MKGLTMTMRSIQRMTIVLLLCASALAAATVSARPASAAIADHGRDARPSSCDVEYLGSDLTGNRHNALPAGRLQVVLFYDGSDDGSPTLNIQLNDGSSIDVGGRNPGGHIEPFGREIATREYDVGGCAPTGEFRVSGVVPNGVIDGLAFGLLWRDADGRYTMLKSPAGADTGAMFVGMWPLGFNNDQFEARTSTITTGFGRSSARAIITGAALAPNGSISVAVPAGA